MAKIILFVDAMEPEEYGGGWQGTERGLVESGHPKVTPKVTSEVYTGESPSVNGMGRVHSMKGDAPSRPMLPTIQEKLQTAGYNVGSFHMPYCTPLQLQNQMWVGDTRQGKVPGQNQLAHMMAGLPTAGHLSKGGEEMNRGFNTRIEDILSRSAEMIKAINLAELDVVFLGIRSPDEFTHFGWDSGYRERLLEEIAHQVARWEVNHDILWWSDHGSQEKKETFRVNKWLVENGYLDLEIDLEFHERFQNEMESRAGQGQQQAIDVENQLGIQSPGVEIKESSQAVCVDPYDSCIDSLSEELDKQELIDDMMSTGMYRSVKLTEDEWGKGEFLDSCPDLVTLRADHVLVTSNVHPDPIGMGFYRSGVHSAYGAWGATDPEFKRRGDVTPRQLHDVIWEFVTGSSQMEQQVQAQVEEMRAQMEQARAQD